MIDKPCCRECKGPAPFFFCRSARCTCHHAGPAKGGQSLHADPTANAAIKRIMKGK